MQNNSKQLKRRQKDMNNNLQTRLELQGAVQQWTASFMQNNGISAAMMEDALNKVLLKLKDRVLEEFLIEQQQAYEQAMNSVSQEENINEDIKSED
jgi:hypothetical protein